jgi:hypothetical protein
VSAHTAEERLSHRIDDLRDELRDLREEMRAGFSDVRAEIRTLRGRLDTLLLATVGGLLGVIATLVAKA